MWDNKVVVQAQSHVQREKQMAAVGMQGKMEGGGLRCLRNWCPSNMMARRWRWYVLRLDILNSHLTWCRGNVRSGTAMGGVVIIHDSVEEVHCQGGRGRCRWLLECVCARTIPLIKLSRPARDVLFGTRVIE